MDFNQGKYQLTVVFALSDLRRTSVPEKIHPADLSPMASVNLFSFAYTVIYRIAISLRDIFGDELTLRAPDLVTERWDVAATLSGSADARNRRLP
jgi:hypothetical protein